MQISITVFNDLINFGLLIHSQNGKRKLVVTHPVVHSEDSVLLRDLPQYA